MPRLSRRQIVASSAALACTAGAGALALRLAAPRPAPRTTFSLLGGGVLRTSDWQGQVALVNFWATSCVTCVGEMPRLVQLHHEFQAQGLHLLAVAMRYDPPAYVAHFARTRQLPFQVALDTTGEAARQWADVRATPTTFLLDRRGRIVQRIVGEPDFSLLRTRIQRELAASA